MKTHQLAPLPYAYNALEPLIDARTMEIHHSKHQAYVDNLNKALSGTPYESMLLEELFPIVQDLPTAIRNNAGGHYNHSLFWSLISPSTVAEPSAEQVRIMKDLSYPVIQTEVSKRQPAGELIVAINQDFGSFDNFKIKFAEAATTRFGSGWAWLIWSQDDQKLIITSTPNQDNPLMQLPEIVSGTPIIGLDVWEHAYYLHYQNRRPNYIEAFWKLINWDAANYRYLKKG